MSDDVPSTSSAETSRPTTVVSQSGGVDIDARHDVNIGGDVTGRDKITSVNTGGGAHVEGNVQTAEFVGRDKTIIQPIINIFQGDAAQRDLRNRRNMLERVKNYWVKGVLEKSLYHEVMLDLGLEERPGEVQNPWDMTLKMPDHENRPLPPGTKIIQVFDEMNHALLILGEPGSGKTTMLLELARDTIARAEQDPTQLIPVVLNLSTWSVDPKQPIADWLVRELHDKYDVHKKIAQPWIDNDDLMLLLDGLDEVKAERREACVKAINDFRDEHGQTQLAVCCRFSDYLALATRSPLDVFWDLDVGQAQVTKLRLHGAVLIQPLTVQQIDDYLKRGGEELVAVRKSLQHDIELQELAKFPLMLGIMTLVYKGLSSTAIADEQTKTRESRRKQLFDAYVGKMFDRGARTKTDIYPEKESLHWLSWLAQLMTERAQSVFFFDQISQQWLSTVQKRIHRLLSGLITGLAFGLSIGLILGLVGRLSETVKVGLILGLIMAPVFGVIHRPLITYNWSWKKAWIGMISGLLFGLIIGLMLGLIGSWSGVADEATRTILIYVLLAWMFLRLAGSRWSRTKAWMKPTGGLLSWLVLGVALVLIGSIEHLRVDLGATIFLGLAIGLVSALMGWLNSGLQAKTTELQTTYDQVVRYSAVNTAFVVLMSGLLGGLVVAMVSILIGGSILGGIIIGLSGGLTVGVIAGSWSGGAAIISHFTLRFVLYRNGDIPWNYVRFLDYAADRIFLRKVGGGYIFIHRMVMEYFASLKTEPSAGKR